jgi:hypothetical protein
MKEMDMIGTLVKLADLGVTGVKVTYEGSGDSGYIDNIVYSIDKMDEDEENAFNDLNDISIWGKDAMNLKDLDSGLASDIEDFVEDRLLQDIENWWNDDGGYGTVCILIPSGKYKITNDIRITEVETYYHDGSLIEKTL